MNDFDDDEKQQKPKKFAEISVVIWDDAEIDVDCVKFVKTGSGRGAPKKVVMLNKKEFMDDVDSEIMSKYGIMKTLKDELKLDNLKLSYLSDEELEGSQSCPSEDVDSFDDEIMGDDDFA